MTILFELCALIGGTFLLCQFVMTLLGMGHEGLDTDLSHASAGASHEHGGDFDLDASHHPDSSWLFGIISFRTMVAATTVFGLAGMTARTGGFSLANQLLVALLGGGAAMFGVHWLMRSLLQLGQNGTLRVSNAIGKSATVSIAIPASRSGRGKVRLTVQGRLEELAAVNSTTEALATGCEVLVVDVVGGNILEVAPLQEPAKVAQCSSALD